MGIPCTVLRFTLHRHSAREEQEWKARKRVKEDNTLCEEGEIGKEASG